MTPHEGRVCAKFKKLRNGCATARGRTLTLSSKGVSSPLWDRTPSGKEELAIDLGQLASHSLPLGSPSLDAKFDLKRSSNFARGEYQIWGFLYIYFKISFIKCSKTKYKLYTPRLA